MIFAAENGIQCCIMGNLLHMRLREAIPSPAERDFEALTVTLGGHGLA